jgi:cytochrome c biogenesis protein
MQELPPPQVPLLRPDAVSEVAELPPLTEEQSHVIVEQVWRFFCSLRLTLANFLGLFLAMIAGTFVNPQNDSLANIERVFAGRSFVLWSYRTFELYDLFHSWWFTLLLTSLALNFIACSLERLPRIWYLIRYPTLRLDEVKGLRFRAAEQPSTLTPAAVEHALKEEGYRVTAVPREGGGADLFAEKGRYSRFGVWVIHLSILGIMAGGIVGRFTAFEGTADVPGNGGRVDSMIIRNPDGSAYRRKLGFVVQCDDFRLREFSPGRPKAFESDLRVFSNEPGREGQVMAKKTITVNDPLKYGGLTLYQASYRQLEESSRARVVLIDKASGREQEFFVGAGEPLDAAEGLSYQLVDYQEDFAGMGPAVQVVRVEEPPGALVNKAMGPRRVPSPQAKLTSFWVFQKRPDFDKDNRTDRFALRFVKVAPLYATGLQIARDPSIPVVYTGCFFMFIGLFIAFYTAHKRVWAKVDAGTIALGGAAHRNQEAFAQQFDRLCEKLHVTPLRKNGGTAKESPA